MAECTRSEETHPLSQDIETVPCKSRDKAEEQARLLLRVQAGVDRTNECGNECDEQKKSCKLIIKDIDDIKIHIDYVSEDSDGNEAWIGRVPKGTKVTSYCRCI